MKKKTHNAHDKIFKAAFQYPETAKEFITAFLPEEISGIINFDAFAIDKNDYIAGNMKELFSDVVYTADMNGGKSKIAFLFEHKSKPETYIRVQVMNYINAIHNKDILEGKPLTFVLPIVIYQGKRKWKIKAFYDDFKKLPQHLRRFLPEFDILLLQINEVNGEKILSLSDDSMLKSLFAAYKYAKDAEFLKKNLNNMLSFYVKRPETFAFLQQILIYLFSQSDLDREVMTDVLEHISSPIKKEAMTTYAQIKQEGRIEGKIEGKIEGRNEGRIEGKVETEKFFVENLHKMGIPLSQIISLVKTLSKDEVMQIIENLRK